MRLFLADSQMRIVSIIDREKYTNLKFGSPFQGHNSNGSSFRNRSSICPERIKR